jgi:hypothetical protein
LSDEKKLGRPFSKNPKSVKLTVRIDNSEAKILDDYCARKEVNRADGVREAIRDLKHKK